MDRHTSHSCYLEAVLLWFWLFVSSQVMDAERRPWFVGEDGAVAADVWPVDCPEKQDWVVDPGRVS